MLTVRFARFRNCWLSSAVHFWAAAMLARRVGEGCTYPSQLVSAPPQATSESITSRDMAKRRRLLPKFFFVPQTIPEDEPLCEEAPAPDTVELFGVVTKRKIGTADWEEARMPEVGDCLTLRDDEGIAVDWRVTKVMHSSAARAQVEVALA